MNRVLFTEFDTVEYCKKENGIDKNYYFQINDFFEIIKKDLYDSSINLYLQYDEETNKFTLLRNENKYEFITTKKQMEEFKNNENTLFNNRIRECLKLSEEKRQYNKIKESGVFDGVNSAMFFLKYIDDRGTIGNIDANGAREYIAKNVTEDFDKCINYFNDRIELLKNKVIDIKNEHNKEQYYGFIFCLILSLIITIFSIIFHDFLILSLLLIPFMEGYCCFQDIYDDVKYRNNTIARYNKEIKKIEEAKEKLKEKEHEVNKTSSVTKEEKIDKNEFESKLAYSLYLLRKEASELEKTEKEYVDLETKNISKFYNDEMKSFEYQKGQYKLTLETEQTIQNKVVKRIQELDNYISLRKNKSNQEYEIDEDIVMQISNSNNAFIRTLKQGIK